MCAADGVPCVCVCVKDNGDELAPNVANGQAVNKGHVHKKHHIAISPQHF